MIANKLIGGDTPIDEVETLENENLDDKITGVYAESQNGSIWNYVLIIIGVIVFALLVLMGKRGS